MFIYHPQPPDSCCCLPTLDGALCLHTAAAACVPAQRGSGPATAAPCTGVPLKPQGRRRTKPSRRVLMWPGAGAHAHGGQGGPGQLPGRVHGRDHRAVGQPGRRLRAHHAHPHPPGARVPCQRQGSSSCAVSAPVQQASPGGAGRRAWCAPGADSPEHAHMLCRLTPGTSRAT